MREKTPMELLKEIAPEFAQSQMNDKKTLFDDEKYQQIPKKYKFLIGLATAAALGSDMCTRMWTKQAIASGANKSEVTEAMMVARFLKQATVNDTIASSIETYMLQDEGEKNE